MWVLLAVALLAQSADFDAAGKKALAEHKYADAIEAFRQAVAASPNDYGAHFNLGYAYTMASQFGDAAAEYQKVLDLHPGVYEAQVNLAASLLRLNRFAEAEAGYRAALALKPEAPAAEEGLGRALAREEKLADAEPHYRKAAALDASYKDSLLELGSAYEDHHQAQEAIAIFREFPENPAAQERMGALLLESGKAADAIAPLEYAVAHSPTAANRLELAQAYSKNQQVAKAEPLAAAALAAAPKDNGLRMFYGRLLRDQRKFPEAATQFKAAAAQEPQLAEAWSELAGVYLITGQYQEALTDFEHVRALHAETPGVLFFRATAHDHLHQAKEALDNYNRFLAASKGAFPDQEFQARQRIKILERELGR